MELPRPILVEEPLRATLYQTRDVAQSGCLSLYDVNLFGDLQIRVRCDATTKKVVDRLIVLD